MKEKRSNPTRRAHYLQQLGVDDWRLRDQTASLASKAEEVTWSSLEQQVKTCTKCALCQGRTHAVFGVGSHQAKLMLVGEAPGMNEDLQGEPFVGRAGKLLNEMLKAIGLKREEVFICNVIKCRPPNNRDPKAEEVATCSPYLEQQVNLLKPELILALGRISAQYLLGVDTPLGKLRGQRWSFGKQATPLYATYHPAYLLRSPKEKAKAYRDLLILRQVLDK